MAEIHKNYYAGPLFTDAERDWNAQQAEILRERLPGVELLLPQEFCAKHEAPDTADQGTGRLGKPDYAAIFRECRDHLDQASHVITVLDGADVDSGTAWEAGYAYAKGKTILGLRTDWRPAEDGSANAMLSRSCNVVCASISDVIQHLKIWLRLD